MSVASATASTGVGGGITLDVTAANVSAPGLGGYVIILTWDPAVLTMISLTDSGWVTGGNIIVICTTPTIDNTAGTAELDCTPIYGFGSGVTTSGPQALAQAVFHANALGTTAVDLTGSILLDPLNVAIQTTTLTSGSVMVTPASVGGVAESPDIAALPAPSASGAAGARRSAYAGLAVGAALLVAAWTFRWAARRRR
jgi:hypothetical protein